MKIKDGTAETATNMLSDENVRKRNCSTWKKIGQSGEILDFCYEGYSE